MTDPIFPCTFSWQKCWLKQFQPCHHSDTRLWRRVNQGRELMQTELLCLFPASCPVASCPRPHWSVTWLLVWPSAQLSLCGLEAEWRGTGWDQLQLEVLPDGKPKPTSFCSSLCGPIEGRLFGLVVRSRHGWGRVVSNSVAVEKMTVCSENELNLTSLI